MKAVFSIYKFGNDVIATSSAPSCSQYDILHYRLGTPFEDPDDSSVILYPGAAYLYTAGGGFTPDNTKDTFFIPPAGGGYDVGSYYTYVNGALIKCAPQLHGN